ncbi:ABC transporter permease [Fulvivirga sediminis]|uniref:ABC transporter permease n=1 Tax=Fulvivirga sediminis TaxID=2803949 RepID=A0A937FAJ1_9BACT|nr:ABC transporter permease [Fulvivirga sediminis]MBL3658012.1 ABC transporter permease [Fulvivirga sediminis]
MLKLLKIDLQKLANYRAFWVLNIMYGVLIISIPVVVLEFMKWLKEKGADFNNFDPMKIPVLHFPDIWQNITYVYTFLKIFLAIVVIISISNEFSYKTIRQNIIDGFSRMDFIKSKMSTILLLSLGSALLVFITGLLTGLIYTPDLEMGNVFDGSEFVLAYFLDLFCYLTLAFLLTVLLKRSALTVFMLLLFSPIERTIAAFFPANLKFITEYFPIHAINNLIAFPLSRYWFQEIQDYVSLSAVGVVLIYIVIFVYAIYYKLKSSDL